MSGADAGEQLRGELIVAAFGEPAAALAAWRRWREGSGWERHVDFESFLLLPRIYRNLGGQPVDDPLYSRLRGVIRRNWAANTQRIALLRRLLSLPGSVAGGIVLPPPHALLCDDASAAFAGEHPRLLLPRHPDGLALARTLLRTGWRCHGRQLPAWCLAGYAAARPWLVFERGDDAVELHLVDSIERLADGGLSGVAVVTCSLGGTPVRCLGAVATVRYLLEGPGQGPLFRRVARALLYLERRRDVNAWALLLRFLREAGAPWADAVAGLAPEARAGVFTTADTPAPRDRQPVPAVPGRLPFLKKQREHWRQYRDALGEQTGGLAALAQLPGYLMGKWGLAHPAAIPGRLLRGLRSDWRYRQ